MSASAATTLLRSARRSTLAAARASGSSTAAPRLARGRASAVDPADLASSDAAASSPPFAAVPRAAPPPDGTTRHDWKRQEVAAIYNSSLLDVIFRAAAVHRMHHPPGGIQLCTLMNIKEGGCSEDCGYCSQSSRYTTPSTASKLAEVDEVLVEARKARDNGSTRFCMGAAWREVGGRKRGFNRILEMVSEIR
jgi:biotin synthase